ncbi:ribosome recycling factor-domain-containing protein [Armillaria nabsnona]|nr:ribosome recycling factor-domain-containing protein [Armillaria nabsnona]
MKFLPPPNDASPLSFLSFFIQMSPSTASEPSAALSLSTTSRSRTKLRQESTASVEWLRRDCADASARTAGRVTLARLANVRVKEQKLEEVATVGVRDGSMLVVTVFDEEYLKHVDAAIYDAKIPSITPQRQDTRTLRIPVPKPTLDAESSVVTAAAKKAVDALADMNIGTFAVRQTPYSFFDKV